MSLKKTDTHVHSLKVRYSEIDSQSIVYNSHYLTYYVISLADLLDQVDLISLLRIYRNKLSRESYKLLIGCLFQSTELLSNEHVCQFV